MKGKDHNEKLIHFRALPPLVVCQRLQSRKDEHLVWPHLWRVRASAGFGWRVGRRRSRGVEPRGASIICGPSSADRLARSAVGAASISVAEMSRMKATPPRLVARSGDQGPGTGRSGDRAERGPGGAGRITASLTRTARLT